MKEKEAAFGWSALPGALQQRWPRDGSGDFVAPRYLATRSSVDMADVFLINLLEAYGIPVLRSYPGDGAFGKVVLGMSGTGSALYVPETLYEKAKDLMEADFELEDSND